MNDFIVPSTDINHVHFGYWSLCGPHNFLKGLVAYLIREFLKCYFY